jgi:hypothetical protein
MLCSKADLAILMITYRLVNTQVFKHSLFLVLCNRITSFTVALVLLLVSTCFNFGVELCFDVLAT